MGSCLTETTMAMYKFVASGDRAGKDFVLLDQYMFVKGEMTVTGKEARQLRPLLEGFYACQLVKIHDPNEGEPTDPMLQEEDEVVDVTPQPN